MRCIEILEIVSEGHYKSQGCFSQKSYRSGYTALRTVQKIDLWIWNQKKKYKTIMATLLSVCYMSDPFHVLTHCSPQTFYPHFIPEDI